MVGLVDDYVKKFPINSRIKLHADYGTVKYIGEVEGHLGLWLGIEWDDIYRGKHDGFVNGKRYFQTINSTSGSLIRPAKIENFESVEIAAKNRYLINDCNSLDEDLMRETQQHLQASVFEIVGMDKIAKKQSKINELTEIDVTTSMASTAGDLSAFKSLTSIHLSSTLIWNWRIVAEIIQQIPTLRDINLSCNRLVLPTESDIKELEPIFRQINHINLRKCGYRNWTDITTTAKLWPNLEYLGLQENDIKNIQSVDNNSIFKNLKELDLHLTNLSDFNEICKLGNITTLKSLLLMDNNIMEIKLPDCDPNEKLTIFPNLQSLNLFQNPLRDDSFSFNELDKLPSLVNLCKTHDQKIGFEEMFSMAVALIPNLKTLNKINITKDARRGAEYDIWKKYGLEWQKIEVNPITKIEFSKRYRSYSKIVQKYGSPAEFSIGPVAKISSLVNIFIKYKLTGEIWEKKIPRKISIQTLQGLIIKQFKIKKSMPRLSYIDANHPELVVELNNLSKNLDYYSIQDGDTVVVE